MDSKRNASSQVNFIKTAEFLEVYGISRVAVQRIKRNAEAGLNGIKLIEYQTTRGEKRTGIADIPENRSIIRELVKKGRKNVNKKYRK